MRLFLLAALLAFLPSLSACRTQERVIVSDPAFDYSKTFPASPPLPKQFSGITYQTEIVSYGVDGKHVKVIQAIPDYALPAYGGLLLGGDRGEWGGELVFRKQNESIQPVLEKNVHGIFQMPFGIVVFTGLAHMGINEGSIYRVSSSSNGTISVTVLHDLPGAPSDVFRTTANDLVFRVISGKFEKQGAFSVPVKDCYLLDKSGALKPLRCTSIIKQVKRSK